MKKHKLALNAMLELGEQPWIDGILDFFPCE